MDIAKLVLALEYMPLAIVQAAASHKGHRVILCSCTLKSFEKAITRRLVSYITKVGIFARTLYYRYMANII